MTPHFFIQKWRSATLTERAAAQSHFNDLCALLGEPTPTDADPRGDWFAFEKGATKTGGGQGWADVWKKGCFAWEYKGKHKDLGAALRQLQQYALALDNPPLLIVCDLESIEIHTHFTNTVHVIHRLTLDDLADGQRRSLLKWAFSDPERLKPTQTTASVTAQAAETFAHLAQRLRDRGHAPQRVAHFITRLLFCMFAEDIGLLPRQLFTRLLAAALPQPARFTDMAQNLFAAMSTGGVFGVEVIAWFNGGLFNDPDVIPLDAEDMQIAYRAALLDWSAIEPAIFGTLFERGLDPDKRSQLGAHYTDRAAIERLIAPVIREPLRAEWGQVKATISERLLKKTPKARQQVDQALQGFLERLRLFRVLDPACGSGNFLYLALQMLKDLEHEVMLEAEQLGLQRGFPLVGPEAVWGIEVNPYAAELARVTVWIGEIQWMLGRGYNLNDQPILKPLQQILCRDALLSFLPAPSNREALLPSPAGRGVEDAFLLPSPFGRGVGGEGIADEEVEVRGEGSQMNPPLPLALRHFARELRKNQTDAENLLWRLLRSRRLGKFKFRRQHPIPPFIVPSPPTPLPEGEGSMPSPLTPLPEGEESMPSPPTPLPEGEGSAVSLLEDGECREADWPVADVIVGNPPFLGGSKLLGLFGESYVENLRRVYRGRVPGGADLVCYWFEKARALIEQGHTQRAGLVATNSIRGGSNRKVLERILETGSIFNAWSDEPWINDGAAVRVSLVCFGTSHPSLSHTKLLPSPSGRGVGGEGFFLNGQPVAEIYADLSGQILTTGSSNLTQAQALPENSRVSFQGSQKIGAFDILGDLARQWLEIPNPHGRPNSDVLKPSWNGIDVTRRPRDGWIIDFGIELSETEAEFYEKPFEYVNQFVKPERIKNNRASYGRFWWRHGEPRVAMRNSLKTLSRYIATPEVAKHRIFIWLPVGVLPDKRLIVISCDDDNTFGILHSKIHEIWSLRLGATLEDRPCYRPTTSFETFPFPAGLQPNIPASAYADDPRAIAIAAAARRLVELRDNWLNPPQWVRRVPEVVPSYPDRLLPVDDRAAAELKKRTLTNLYNQRPTWLANAHRVLDEAVAAAYGWPADLSDEEILRRLLALNLERAHDRTP